MPKMTARQNMEAWRAKAIGDLVPLKKRVSLIINELKSLRTDAIRTVGKTGSLASKMSTALSNGIEERHKDVHSALVKEVGEDEAFEMIDTDEYPDTSEEDARDEAAASLLDDIPSTDPEDLIDQTIDPLESLEEQISELLKHLKGIK
jgi:hypothetical protein